MKDISLPTEYPIDLTPYTHDGEIKSFLIRQKLETLKFSLEGLILAIIFRNINKCDTFPSLDMYKKSIQLLVEKSHDISEFFRYSVGIKIPLGYNVLPLIISKMMVDAERLPISYSNDDELCAEIERYINDAKILKRSISKWESTPKSLQNEKIS